MLAEVHHEIHPFWLAYLNFYTALSHDTLAREASLKNRYKELSLAEKHYIAAIATLTPPETQPSDEEQLTSPTSIYSNENRVWNRRASYAGSIDSTTSSASSATSYQTDMLDLDSETEQEPEAYSKRNTRFQYTQPSREFGSELTTIPQLLKRHNIAITAPLPERPQTPQQYRFTADTAAFVRRVQGHLASVQELKEKTSVPAVRFMFSPRPSPRPSPTMSKPRTSHLFDDEDAETVRQGRRVIKFRARFDPSSVQKLCSEALAELH